MNAETEIRAALMAQLRGDASLSGMVNRIHDGTPVKASAPYVSVGECIGTDWGCKDRDGREVRLSIAIVDEAESGGRIGQIMPLVEAGVRQVALAGVPGWQMGGAGLVRSRLVGQAQGRWTAVLDFRLRMLRES